jgi:hypothetical protein
MGLIIRMGAITGVVALAIAVSPATAHAQAYGGVAIQPYYSNYGSPYAYVGPNGVGLGYGYPVNGYYGGYGGYGGYGAYGYPYGYGNYGNRYNSGYYNHPGYHNYNYGNGRANTNARWHNGWH